MRYFLLVTFIVFIHLFAHSQVTVRTVRSGNYNNNSTWSGGIKPPASDCTIEIESGHQLTLDVNVTLANAKIVLKGPNSVLLFANNIQLTLTGTSAIDLQGTNSSIFSDKANNTITLANTVIFTGKQTSVNTTEKGRVLAPASASSLRSSPTFQNFTLPVVLNSFTLNYKNNKVVVSWKTDMEINSDYFEVQRSVDSKSWMTIGEIKAAGDANILQIYSCTDNNPHNGFNYYRLKIVDRDLKFEYGPVKFVDAAAGRDAVRFAPNPARSVLNISVNLKSNTDYQVSLISGAGQVLFSQKYQASIKSISLPVNSFPEGTYFVRLRSEGAPDVVRAMLIAK